MAAHIVFGCPVRAYITGETCGAPTPKAAAAELASNQKYLARGGGGEALETFMFGKGSVQFAVTLKSCQCLQLNSA